MTERDFQDLLDCDSGEDEMLDELCIQYAYYEDRLDDPRASDAEARWFTLELDRLRKEIVDAAALQDLK